MDLLDYAYGFETQRAALVLTLPNQQGDGVTVRTASE
jgi:hypothetical protein